jgi:hypothetical protein
VVEQPRPHGGVLQTHPLGVEPRVGWETQPRDFCQRVAFFVVQAGEHVAAATGLEGVDNQRNLVVQHPKCVRLDREHARHAHHRSVNEWHCAVPHVVPVLDASDRAVRTAAAAEHVPVRAVLAVLFRREYT